MDSRSLIGAPSTWAWQGVSSCCGQRHAERALLHLYGGRAAGRRVAWRGSTRGSCIPRIAWARSLPLGGPSKSARRCRTRTAEPCSRGSFHPYITPWVPLQGYYTLGASFYLTYTTLWVHCGAMLPLCQPAANVHSVRGFMRDSRVIPFVSCARSLVAAVAAEHRKRKGVV